MKTYRILWANDTTPVIINSIISLELENYQFTIAHSDNGAMEQLKTKTFDLVIANLASTAMNGLGILKKAKEFKPDITTIAQAEPGNMKILMDALRFGVDDFLFIPYKVEEVLLKIFNSLNNEEQWQEIDHRNDILTVCCDCKKVKVANPHGYGFSQWMPIENYLWEKLKVTPTSTYCPKCAEKAHNEMDMLTYGKTCDDRQNLLK